MPSRPDLAWHAVEGHVKDLQKQISHKRKMNKSRSNVASDEDFRSELHKRLHGMLHSSWFEGFFGFIILVNMIIVIIETDAVAKGKPIPLWSEVASWSILALFVFELCLRIFILRFDFWIDECNIFDFVLVTVDTCLNFVSLVAAEMFPVSFLRIARLCKLARVSKAFRIFPELRLMMGGLVGSVKAIFWGTVLLSFSILIASILAVQFIDPLNDELTARGEYTGVCERCPRAYASVFDASLTFCQQLVAGDGWGQGNVQIIEEYPATGIFFAYAFMSIGMAILNLILGVVVDVASQAREKMRKEIDDEKLVEMLQVHSHLLDICTEMDEDGNGELTREELLTGYENHEKFRDVLSSMDIEKGDLEVLWTCLDEDRSGAVNYTEFVTSCYKLKSSNTHFMLAYIKYYITLIKNKICHEIEELKTDVDDHLSPQHLREAPEKKREQAPEEAKEENNMTVETDGASVEEKFGRDLYASPALEKFSSDLQGPAYRSAQDVFEIGRTIEEFKQLLTRSVGEIREMVNVRRPGAFTLASSGTCADQGALFDTFDNGARARLGQALGVALHREPLLNAPDKHGIGLVQWNADDDETNKRIMAV
jgi:Ca2+-binding EF-hand superfamily protein